MTLQLVCNGLFKHLRVHHCVQVVLHERLDGATFGLLAHLEGVADFNVIDTSKWVFAID